MSLSDKFAPHLTDLRRYARALSGNQVGGDRYVVATLEAMIADPGMIDEATPPRLELFRIFSKVWGPVVSDVPANHDQKSDLERLDVLTPRPRQAFLLLSLENFDVDEVARILNVGAAEVGTLISDAARQISEDVQSKVLIIEDEPLILMDLKSLMEGLGHTVPGTARTHKQAVEVASEVRPDIILADIQLADGSSGIEAVNEILLQFEVPVIFITAYPERLLTGERPEPTYLVPKPFRPEMVKAIVSQAIFFGEKARSGQIADTQTSPVEV